MLFPSLPIRDMLSNQECAMDRSIHEPSRGCARVGRRLRGTVLLLALSGGGCVNEAFYTPAPLPVYGVEDAAIQVPSPSAAPETPALDKSSVVTLPDAVRECV